MNNMNRLTNSENFGGEGEAPICHLIGDKLGLRVDGLTEGAK